MKCKKKKYCKTYYSIPVALSGTTIQNYLNENIVKGD